MNIKKKIRHAVRWFMPFGVVRWYTQKRGTQQLGKAILDNPKEDVTENFMEGLHQYIAGKDTVALAEQSPFETIVTVQGFGYSGSGAVVDLLREYKDVRVVGFVDAEGSLTSANEECEEVDILRLSGGLFEVEKYLNSNNAFQNDALIHRLIDVLEKSSIYICYPEIHKYFYELLRLICHTYAIGGREQFYNTHINYHGYNDIFALNPITVEEYRNICRKFLNSILSVFKTTETMRYLVLDQFIADGEYDFERYRQYIPNLKSLVVYRDPRDIFIYARLSHEDWIPNNEVREYIRWYKSSIKFFNKNEKELYHVVQFERLIEEYEEHIRKIESYLGINEKLHIKSKQHFDPNVSKENMQLYKKYPNVRKELDVIKEELHTLCYED